GSRSPTVICPLRSLPGRIERNFSRLNSLPFIPTRVWWKNTPPRDPIAIEKAINTRKGESMINMIEERTISNSRFMRHVPFFSDRSDPRTSSHHLFHGGLHRLDHAIHLFIRKIEIDRQTDLAAVVHIGGGKILDPKTLSFIETQHR